MDPIPLASPTGAVYAYACGACHNVHAGEFALGGRDAEDVQEAADRYRASAESCCLCKRCKHAIATLDFFYCTDCAPLERADREKASRERELETAERHRAQHESLLKSTNETSARALQQVMSDLSEDNWCAGWNTDCEFELWSLLAAFKKVAANKMPDGHSARDPKPTLWGMGEIEAKSLEDLDALSQAAGGWWHWPRDAASPLFVTFAEWQEIWVERQRVDAN